MQNVITAVNTTLNQMDSEHRRQTVSRKQQIIGLCDKNKAASSQDKLSLGLRRANWENNVIEVLYLPATMERSSFALAYKLLFKICFFFHAIFAVAAFFFLVDVAF